MKKAVNVYEACDKAIQALNRQNLEAFGKLKMAKWDEVNVIRTVMSVYRTSAKRARKRYYEVAFEAYLLGLYLCGEDAKKAHQMAEKAITAEWIDDVLSQTDLLTLYRFDTETERKAYRLAETLEVAQDRDYEINKALRYWSQQIGQFAINVTDYAMIQAYMDFGVKEVRWVTQKDERVCSECGPRDEQVFPIDEVPPKHYGCRCWLAPVLG